MNLSIHKQIAERIKKLREASSLSQQDLANLIGVSRSTISYIETVERKISAEELQKLSEVFGLSLNQLMDFEPSYNVSDTIAEYKTEETFYKQNKEKDSKFKEVLMYILSKIGAKHNVGETVIYKVLYYIDFDYYFNKKKKLIGAVYIKNNFGPTPRDFKKIVDKMIENRDLIRVKVRHHDYPQTKYLPLRDPDISVLNAEELLFIDKILEKHSDKKAVELTTESHQDPPWLNAKIGSIINYEDVFFRSKN